MGFYGYSCIEEDGIVQTGAGVVAKLCACCSLVQVRPGEDLSAAVLHSPSGWEGTEISDFSGEL